MKHRPLALGLALALLTVLVLALAHRSVGYVRDEGVYFEASRHYAAWAARMVREPGTAATAQVRDRYFRINHEHPALMKLAAGISARMLSRAPVAEARADRDTDAPSGGLIPAMSEGAAMRLPAQILAGLGVFLLFWAGRARAGTLGAGALAAGWFVLLPRVFFHAGLHAFDVPIAVATLAVVLAYRRALEDPRWALALGPLLGIAIAIKHNALFIGPLLLVHQLACLAHARVREHRRIRLGQCISLPFVAMGVLAPLVAFALWPWLWSDPIARIGEYLAFHREHAYYNMEFLGENYNRPPLPVAYPFVMTFATVPSALLVLALAGLGLGLRDDLRARSVSAGEGTAIAGFVRPLPDGWPRLDGLLFALFGLFPLILIAMPTIPIFGGTKHWFTAYPFLALAAAVAWGRGWKAVDLPPRWRGAPALALLLVLLPGAWSTLDAHPFGLSQYSPLVGGPRGAASLGLNRGFWGHAVPPLLTDAQAEGDRARIYLHDVHDLARRQYAREGRWPDGWTAVPLGRADAGLLFHELHTSADEVELWNALGTTRPRSVLTLDDVPLTSLYAR